MSASLDEQLLKAVGQYNYDLVRKLLDRGARVNEARDTGPGILTQGMTCLMKAINTCRFQSSNGQVSLAEQKLDLTMVNLLLEAGADVMAQDFWGKSCLHYAVTVDRTGELIKILLEAGAKCIVNHRNAWDSSPLGVFLGRNDRRLNRKLIVQMFVDAGTELSTDCCGKLRLKEKDDDEIFRILLTTPGAGTAISSRNHSSIKLFDEAVRYSRIDVVKQMIDLGANVNSIRLENDREDTPLQIAVKLGFLNKVNLLLEHGADPDAVNCRGASAISYLVRYFIPCRIHKNILRALLKHRKREDGSDGSAPLRKIVQYGSIACFEFYRDLIKEGVVRPINEPLLLSALINKKHRMLQYLLDKGICDINEKEKNGLTPFSKLVELYSVATAHYYPRCPKQHRYFRAIENFIRCIALFESKEHTIDPDIHIVINQNEDLQHFYLMCKVELQTLQCLTIDGSITYHSIVAKDGLSTWIKNERVMSILKSLDESSENLSKSFPNYHCLFISSTQEALKERIRQDLMNSAMHGLEIIMRIDSDIFLLIHEKILCNLDNKDLSNLSKVLDTDEESTKYAEHSS